MKEKKKLTEKAVKEMNAIARRHGFKDVDEMQNFMTMCLFPDKVEDGFRTFIEYLAPFGEKGIYFGPGNSEMIRAIRYNPDIVGKICVRGPNRGLPYNGIQVNKGGERTPHWCNWTDDDIDLADLLIFVEQDWMDYELFCARGGHAWEFE